VESKLSTILVYLIFGLAVVGLLAANVLRTRDVATLTRRRACAVAALLAMAVFLTGSTAPAGWMAILWAAASALVCSAPWRMTPRRVDWPSAIVLFATFCFAWTIAWWRRNTGVFNVSWHELLVLHGVLMVATLAFSARHVDAGERQRTWWPVGVAFLFGGVMFLFSTGLYRQPWILWLSWHHWGAYIGPAQLACAGVPLFHDAPAQYGLGPTALLAATCGRDSWLAMYAVVGASSLIYSVLMLDIARRVAGPGHRPIQIVLIGLVVFVGLFVWTAYPPIVGSPALTPSVSGLRFLPLAALVWAVIRRDGSRGDKGAPWTLHLLWIAGVFWSPESAVQVTAVWWPYYVWREVSQAERGRALAVFAKANAQLVAWLLGGSLVFLATYRVGYGLWPDLETYFAYALHPPGPLPVSLFGAVWFFGAILLASLAALWTAGGPDAERRHASPLIVVLLAAYGATSYFLGRSHDNNLLNVAAFYVLLLLAMRALPHAPLLRTTSSAMLSALLAYPVLAGWTAWTDSARDHALLEFEPASVTSRFSYMQADGAKANATMAGAGPADALAADAMRGMREIGARYREPVTVLDPPLNLESSNAGRPWSAYHGPENFYYLPGELRRRYLAAVAARLDRTGWVLVRRDFDASAWLTDYDAVYRRDVTLDFGTYYAIRYVPRSSAAGPP
jgi:hypothetical protein